MKKNYIGFANSFHDSAIAIVDDKGAVLFAEATERYLQCKRSIGVAPDLFKRAADLVKQYCDPEAEIVFAFSWSDETSGLMRQGLSLSNLLITVVRKPDGEGHAVLTVRTDKGDFVLDNLTDSVRQWDQTGYRFLKRQAINHTGRWVTIREGQSEPLVGSVK